MAIFDDIGAMLVISLFYSHEIQITPIIGSIAIMLVLFAINRVGIRNGWTYALLGVGLWAFIYNSGLHATLAGMLMALVIPARSHIGEARFIEKIRNTLSVFEKGQRTGVRMLGAPSQHALANNIQDTLRAVSTPLQRWETSLITPIGIIVLPLFALFYAGIPLSTAEISTALSSTVTQGIVVGLVIGKPLGVLLFTFIGLHLRLGKLPEGMRFSEVVACGILAGIGFTMSLFIAILSFENQPEAVALVKEAKIGILFSSLFSALFACIWITCTTGKKQSTEIKR